MSSQEAKKQNETQQKGDDPGQTTASEHDDDDTEIMLENVDSTCRYRPAWNIMRMTDGLPTPMPAVCSDGTVIYPK